MGVTDDEDLMTICTYINIDIHLVMGFGSLVIITLIFLLPSIWFYRRKHEQPIKSRTPWLILMSTFGNYLFVSITVFDIIIHSAKHNNGHQNNWEKTLNSINRLQTLVSHPMFFVPYVLRGARISAIFNISSKYLKDVTIENRRISAFNTAKSLKESFYHKIMIYILAPCLILGIASCFPKVATKMPLAYFDPLFYNSDIAVKNESSFIVAACVALTFFFIEELIFCFLVYKLRNYMKEFNMKRELIYTNIVFITFTMTASGFIVWGCEDFFNLMALIILIFRNLLCFIISVCSPIYFSYAPEIMPYGETRECVSSIEMTLSTITPLTYFRLFIEEEYGSDVVNILDLYMDIKMYEEAASQWELSFLAISANNTLTSSHISTGAKSSLIRSIPTVSSTPVSTATVSVSQVEMLYEMAININNQYLRPSSLKKVNLPEEVENVNITRFNTLSNKLDKHLFDPVYGIVINELHNYFIKFKSSPFFHKLIIQLAKTEIYYERLRVARMN